MSIKQLTKEQALEVINFVRGSLAKRDGDVWFEDNGSSRAVFCFEMGTSSVIM